MYEVQVRWYWVQTCMYLQSPETKNKTVHIYNKDIYPHVAMSMHHICARSVCRIKMYVILCIAFVMGKNNPSPTYLYKTLPLNCCPSMFSLKKLDDHHSHQQQLCYSGIIMLQTKAFNKPIR